MINVHFGVNRQVPITATEYYHSGSIVYPKPKLPKRKWYEIGCQGCYALVPTWNCCNKVAVASVQGCKSRIIVTGHQYKWSCCEQLPSSIGCRQQYQCCNRSQGSIGCERRYPCCNQNEGHVGCATRCQLCHTTWNQGPGCTPTN